MTGRRVVGVLAVTASAVVLIGAMVAYTKRVETRIANAPAGVVKLLKERPELPILTARDLEGRPISTAAFRNKVVLINFWATWCPPCRQEIPDLIALQNKYRDSLQIIGIAQDSGSPEQVRRFAQEHGMNYPIVLSTPEIEKLFPPVAALPTSFFVDHDGRLAQKHVGLLSAALTESETQALAGLNPNLQIVYAEDEDKARVSAAAQSNKIPGVDLSRLSPELRAKVLESLNTEHCSCGCGLTVAQCRVDDPSCNVSLPLAQQLVDRITKGQ